MLIYNGIKNGLIIPFETELFDKLDALYCDGVQVSTLFRDKDYRVGKCYEMCCMLSLVIADCILMTGRVKSIKLSGEGKDSGHAWIEIDGWVYDTNLACKIERNLYYKYQQPTHIISYNNEERPRLDALNKIKFRSKKV